MQTTKADVLYAGADLHGNNVFLSVCDAGGTEVFRRRVKTDLEAVNTALNPFWPNIQQMGVESTFNWYWFVDGLRAQGRNVTLGNPAQMKQYSGLKSTDDRSDARWLAELVRLGIFPQSYIYPEEIRAVRDALRRRQLFVRRRTQVLLSFTSLLTRYGLEAPGSRRVQRISNPPGLRRSFSSSSGRCSKRLNTATGWPKRSKRRCWSLSNRMKPLSGFSRSPASGRLWG